MFQPIELNRVHSATGAFTATVTGATNASPIVVTTSAAHPFVSGDQVQVTGVTGNTAANCQAYVNVLTSTTFQLFSDVNLSVPVVGNGSYSSGGSVSIAFPVANLGGANFQVQLNFAGLQSGQTATVSLQDSTTGFVSDTQDHVTLNLAGGETSGFYQATNPQGYAFTQTQLPSLRVGVSGAALRVNVIEISSGAQLTVSWFFVQ